METQDFLKLSEKEQQEEIKKCNESVSYFYNNYCRKDGMPEYSEKVFEQYKKDIEQKRLFMNIKIRRSGPSPTFIDRFNLYNQYPLTPEEVFKP